MLLVQQNDHWILGSIELYMLKLIIGDVIPEIIFAAVSYISSHCISPLLDYLSHGSSSFQNDAHWVDK